MRKRQNIVCLDIRSDKEARVCGASSSSASLSSKRLRMSSTIPVLPTRRIYRPISLTDRPSENFTDWKTETTVSCDVGTCSDNLQELFDVLFIYCG